MKNIMSAMAPTGRNMQQAVNWVAATTSVYLCTPGVGEKSATGPQKSFNNYQHRCHSGLTQSALLFAHQIKNTSTVNEHIVHLRQPRYRPHSTELNSLTKASGYTP